MAYITASATYHAVLVEDLAKLKLLLKGFTFYYLVFFCASVSYSISILTVKCTGSFFWAILAACSTYLGEKVFKWETVYPKFNYFAFLSKTISNAHDKLALNLATKSGSVSSCSKT